MTGWQFRVDGGGTFTNVVARRPNGTLCTHKLLSDNPPCYADAAVTVIREPLARADAATCTDIPPGLGGAPIDTARMGTTVANIALLERTPSPPSAWRAAPGGLGPGRVERADGGVVRLAGSDRADAGPGDVLVIETPGGGGYGPPPSAAPAAPPASHSARHVRPTRATPLMTDAGEEGE